MMACAPFAHPRIVVDGISVLELTLDSSCEAYLLPELFDIPTRFSATLLSVPSACSSLLAETGAPEIRHLDTPPTVDEEDEEQAVGDREFSTDQEQRPALKTHDGDHGRSSSEKTVVEAEAISPCTPPPVRIVRHIDGSGSFEGYEVASSITLRESDYSIHPSVFDFSMSLMPEITPRTHRPKANGVERRQDMSIAAPTRSRYQRPVDSLLTPKPHPNADECQENPTPVPKQANANKRRPTASFLLIHPPTPTRYQRPADPLLTPNGRGAHNESLNNPSPIPKHRLLKQRSRNSSSRLSANPPTPTATPTPKMCASPLTPLSTTHLRHTETPKSTKECRQVDLSGRCENFNPQSPRRRVQTERKAIGADESRVLGASTRIY